MPKFRVSASEIITYRAEIEAEDIDDVLRLLHEEGLLWDHGKIIHNEIVPESIEIEEI